MELAALSDEVINNLDMCCPVNGCTSSVLEAITEKQILKTSQKKRKKKGHFGGSKVSSGFIQISFLMPEYEFDHVHFSKGEKQI